MVCGLDGVVAHKGVPLTRIRSHGYGRKEPSFRELAQKLPHNLGCIYVGGII